MSLRSAVSHAWPISVPWVRARQLRLSCMHFTISVEPELLMIASSTSLFPA